MKRTLLLSARGAACALTIILLSVARLAAQGARDPQGHWEGAIEIPSHTLDVMIDLTHGADGSWSGTIDIPAQHAKALPLASIAVAAKSVSFSIGGVPGNPTFSGTLSDDGAHLDGTFKQGGGSFPFTLARAGEAEKAAAAASTASTFDSLRTFIKGSMDDFRVPGLAIAIVHHGDVIFSEGFGYRDLEKKLPVTPNTLFAIGSSTKAFTSFVLGTLVDEGKLDWATPVIHYLPTFKLKDEYATEHMTPRDLLLHISGLPRHDLMWYNSPFTRQEIFDRLQYLEPSADFRSKWQYQNMMYMVAGYLAGKVAGSTWEELVRQRIFVPLGMTSSNFSVTQLDTTSDAARGYIENEKKELVRIPYRNIDQIGPAGSINSTIVDMAKWVKLHLGNGTVDGREVISAGTLKDLHRPRVVIGDGDDKEKIFLLYAMGWMAEAYRGHRLLMHGGNIDGFSAMVTFMPDDDIGMVILTNKNGTSLPSAIMYTAYDRLLGLERTDWRAKLASQLTMVDSIAENVDKMQDVARVPGTRPSHKLEEYAGEYENAAYGVMKIEDDHDRLKLTYNGITAPLEHYHYDVFRTAGSDEATKGLKILFQTGMNGDIDRVEAPLEPSVSDIVFKRRGVAIDSATLALYAGEYELAGGIARVAVRNGKTLTLTVPGQPTYELEPYKENEFKLEKLEGYSIRFTMEKGKVTAVTFLQPNGTFVAKRK